MLHENIPTNFRSLGLSEKVKLLSIMYLSVWVTSPLLAYGTIYRILALLAFIVWVVLELFNRRSIFRKVTPHILLMYGFLFYTIPITYMVDGSTILIRNIQLYVIFFFIFVYVSYARKSLEILKPVIYLQIILYTIWIYTTYLGLIVDGHAARFIGKSTLQARELQAQGIGGFSFIYSLLIYIICILALVKYKFKAKKRLVTVFLSFSVILAMLVVLKAEYSTAVLLMVLSVFYFLFWTKNIHKNIIILFIFIVVFIVLKEYLVEILQFFQQFAEGTNYRHKLEDSIESIQAGKASGTAADRTERYIRSIDIFLNNPLLGELSIANVGKHSLLLDTFAQFGLFIGFILIYILFKVPYQILKTHIKNRPLAITILFLIIGLTMLNNIAMSYGFMFYLFYPYIIQRIENA